MIYLAKFKFMRLFLIFSFFISSICTSFSQTYDVVAYQFHQSISEAQQNIGKELFYFNEKADEQNLKIMKFEINRSIAFIDSLKVYNNENAYYNATKKLFSLYKDIADNEYTQLLKLIEDPELEAKDFHAKKKAIFTSIKTKSQVIYPEFLAAQAVFCKKYGIKIE